MEMNREEAIQHIKNSCYIVGYPTHDKQQETRERINVSLDMAIDALQKLDKIEQMKKDMMYDIYMAGINMSGEYNGCYVRFRDIENIVNGHFEVLEDDNN